MSSETLMRKRHVLQVVPASISAIYKWMDEGTFPRPVKIGPRAVAWRASDIHAWLDARTETGARE